MHEILTPRFKLREFVIEDFADVFAYESDPQVVQYVSYGPYNEEECRKDLSWHIAHQTDSKRRFYYLAMELPPENRVIGWCGLKFTEDDRQEGELAYAMHRDYWGKAYMTDAARTMLNFAFNNLATHRVFGKCCPENIGSARVLQKIGMRQEGHLRENAYFKGRWWDTLIFGILEHEWKT